MNREAFLQSLRTALAGIPQEDVDRSVEFYAEMLDDRIEDGVTEEEAVSSVGDVAEIASKIRAELPLPTLMRMNLHKRKLRAWEIVLLTLGSPVWLPVLLSLCIVLAALYLVLWSLILTLYVLAVSLACCFAACIAAAVITYQGVDLFHAALVLGAGCILGGVSILLFMLSVCLTKGVCRMTRSIFRRYKMRLSRKERTQ